MIYQDLLDLLARFPDVTKETNIVINRIELNQYPHVVYTITVNCPLTNSVIYRICHQRTAKLAHSFLKRELELLRSANGVWE